MITFQAIAPSRPARITSRAREGPPALLGSMETMPVAMVSATPVPRSAPTKFMTLANTMAVRGVSARVVTEVAIAFEVSWNPLVNPKTKATATTRTRSATSTLRLP